MWRLYQLLIGLWVFFWTVLCIGPLGNHFYALWKEPPPELIDFLQANWRSELVAVLVVGLFTGLSAIDIRKKRRREKIERQQREQEEQERRHLSLLEQIDHKIRPANHKITALHQLPSPPTNFTGRTTELTELIAVLERGGVVISSLHGMGGIGKTALALKLAEQLTPRYSDAQFYVDLKGASSHPLSPTAAMGHIIRAYHPMAKLPESEAELSGLYRSVLHDQHALLVMDNAANKEQVEPLIPPSSCIMLVTARQHFTLPRLFARRLDILSPNDARDLIIDIVPRIGKHVSALAEVCGYLPLALRVAASTLAERIDLSPEDYLRRLKDAQQLLKLTGVEASLNLSFELLSPDLQHMWCLLAVFRHTFDSEAAAAVWGLELDPAQDILNTLLTYSLVEWNPGNARYRLHDLVHLFTNTRLNKNERAAGQKRHSIYLGS